MSYSNVKPDGTWEQPECLKEVIRNILMHKTYINLKLLDQQEFCLDTGGVIKGKAAVLRITKPLKLRDEILNL